MEKTSFDSVLEVFRQQHSEAEASSALSIIHKLLENMVTHPEERKFRSINKANKVLAAKVFSLSSAEELLRAAGFQAQEGADTLTYGSEDLSAAEDADTLIQVALSELSEALMSVEERKEFEMRRKRDQEIKAKMRQQQDAKRRILEEAKQDRLEASKKLMPTQDSKPTQRGCGKQISYGDIGVDLNRKGG